MYARLQISFAWVLLVALGGGCVVTGRGAPEASEAIVLAHVVRDRAGGFTVSMPAHPEVEHDLYETSHGTLRTVTYTSRLDGAVFLVAYNVFPTGSADQRDPQRKLVAARDGSVRSTGGQVIDERPVRVAGYPGLETTVEVDGGAYRTRIIAVGGNRMYQVLVAAADERTLAEISTAFLESFRLENAAGI